jgi:hypothetical protein
MGTTFFRSQNFTYQAHNRQNCAIITIAELFVRRPIFGNNRCLPRICPQDPFSIEFKR